MKQDAIIRIIALFMIELIILLPFHMADAFAASPTISGVKVTPRSTSADIVWTTNLNASSYIEYGEYSGNLMDTAAVGGYTLGHFVVLEDLDPISKYYYVVKSCTSSYECAETDIMEFSTTKPEPPKAVAALNSTSVTEDSVTLGWNETDNDIFEAYLVYRNNKNIANTTSPEYTDKNLASQTVYSYAVSVVDETGAESPKAAISVTTKAPDTAAPSMTNVTRDAISEDSATISWLTDEESTTTVNYGNTTSVLQNISVEGLTTQHTVTLTGLSNGTVYYYYLESCDAKFNCVRSEQYSLVPGVSDTEPPTIEAVVPEWASAASVDLSGTTEPYAKVRLYINGQYKRMVGMEYTKTGSFIFKAVSLDTKYTSNSLRFEAEDSAGNRAEATYNISIDTKPPSVDLNEIPSVISGAEIPISGTVNEQVTIEVYVKGSNMEDTSAPGTPKNVKYSALESNSVSLAWDENTEEDFMTYAVYRSDVGLIATTSSPEYTDSAVSTSTKYSYQVSAVDQSCNEGSKSSSVSVTSPANGTDQTLPEVATLGCEGESAQQSLEANGDFSTTASASEGTSDVIIIFRDVAGNEVVKSATVTYDANPPEILYTNLDELSPTYTKQVTIVGNVSEWAKIQVYVNGNLKVDTSTDEAGGFEAEISLDRSTSNTSSSSASTVSESFETGSSWENQVVIIATDASGQNSSAEGTITYALCGYGNHWNIVVGEISPNILIPRYLIEGYATIAFDAELKWVGPGDSDGATISSQPIVSTKPLSAADAKIYDEEWIGKTEVSHSDDYRSLYFIIPLQTPYEAEENSTTLDQEHNISDHNVGNCLVPGFGCVKLPLMLSLTYSYQDKYNKSGSITNTQKQCWDIEVAIDQRLPSDMIPKELLLTLINLLNSTINMIDDILVPLKEVRKWVFLACMGSWVVWYVMRAGEYFSCLNAAFPIDPQKCSTVGDSDEAQTCKDCLKSRADTKLFWQQDVQWLCDRIMCPSAPTIEKYIRDAKIDAAKKGTDKKLSNCQSKDESLINFKAREDDKLMEECKKPEFVELREVVNDPWGTPDPKCCEAEYLRQWDSACWGMNELEESFCIKKPLKSEMEAEGIQCGGVKGFFRMFGGICQQSDEGAIVIVDNPAGSSPVYWVVDYYDSVDTSSSTAASSTDASSTAASITDASSTAASSESSIKTDTTNRRRAAWVGEYTQQLTEQKEDTSSLTSPDTGSTAPADSASTKTIDLGGRKVDFGSKESISYSTAPLFQYKDCYENGIIEGGKPLAYEDYIKTYKSNYTNQQADENKAQPIGPASTATSSVTTGKATVTPESSSQIAYPGMLPASVPRAVFDLVCVDTKEYVVDPTSGLWRSLQCVCLTSLTAYLEHYKSILTMIKVCFEQIYYTGDGSAGVCKEVLSVYLCDLIYYAIKCVAEGSDKGQGGTVRGGLGGFMSYVSNSGADVENSVQGRYGSSSIYEQMFVEKKLMHAVCLWAFTGDWDLDLDTFLESEAAVPIDTTCVVTGSRRFMRKNPQSEGSATFMYQLGIFIVSGAEDLSYEVKLVCSGDNSCQSDIDSSGKCDCLSNAKGEQSRVVGTGSGSLAMGEVLNDEQLFEETQPFRYDKIAAEITYTDNQGQEVTKECGTSDLLEVGGAPPADCKFDIVLLKYHCRFEWGDSGYAYFEDVEAVEDTLCLNDYLQLSGKIIKQSPSSDSTENVHLTYKVYLEEGEVPLGENDIVLVEDGEYDLEGDIPGAEEDGFPGLKIDSGFFRYNSESVAESNYQSGMKAVLKNANLISDMIKITFEAKEGKEMKAEDKCGNDCTYTVTDGEDLFEESALSGDYKDNKLELKTKAGATIKFTGEAKNKELWTVTMSSKESEMRDMIVEVSLHREEEDGTAEKAALVYDGKEQVKKISSIVVYNTEDCVKGTKEVENECVGDGYEAESNECDCNGDGDFKDDNGDYPDCTKRNSLLYCYEEEGAPKPSCHEKPSCRTDGTKNTVSCDCDLDGDVERSNDCDGTTKQFCQKSGDTYNCVAESEYTVNLAQTIESFSIYGISPNTAGEYSVKKGDNINFLVVASFPSGTGSITIQDASSTSLAFLEVMDGGKATQSSSLSYIVDQSPDTYEITAVAQDGTKEPVKKTLKLKVT